MSSYENTCPKCGDSYKTEGWEPVKCPFCELAEYQRTEPLKLAERNGLLRELADVVAHRDSETRWASEYKAERDEARECLREAMAAMVGLQVSESNPKWPERWKQIARLGVTGNE